MFTVLLVRLFASYKDHKVFIEQLGSRACGLNGYKTEKGTKIIAQHGDILQVLYGKHTYKIEFNPAPKPTAKQDKSVKRLLSQESEDEEENESQNLKKSKVSTTPNRIEMLPSTSKQTEPEAQGATSSSNSTGLGKDSTSENGTWEHFDNKTLYVYTNNGCQGRSKVNIYYYCHLLCFYVTTNVQLIFLTDSII